MSDQVSLLNDAANRMRVSAIEMTSASKSGHPTSGSSAAEVLATLFFDEMHYEVANPRNPSADRFVLSKVKPFLLCLIIQFIGPCVSDSLRGVGRSGLANSRYGFDPEKGGLRH